MNLYQKIKRYWAIRFPMQQNATKRIISFWEKGGADFEYYNSAESEEWMEVFWKKDSIFYPLFQQLNTEHLLEIACGTGRHSSKIIEHVKTLYLLETSKEALKLAQQRFNDYAPKVHYIHSPDGLGIPKGNIAEASLTAVFSYDAMVHFEKEAVEAYIKDSFRVLKQGGLALLHHSNYDKNPNGKFTDNPGWRNYMTQDLFVALSQKYGFDVLHSEIFSFSCPGSDAITLLQKP